MEKEIMELDRETALLLLMVRECELIINDIDTRMLKLHRQMKREPKMLIGNVMRKIKGLKPDFDRLFEISLLNGTVEDGSDVYTAYMTDANLYLRMHMMVANALHCPDDSGNIMKIESLLKLLAKNPVFDQALIDKMTDYK